MSTFPLHIEALWHFFSMEQLALHVANSYRHYSMHAAWFISAYHDKAFVYSYFR